MMYKLISILLLSTLGFASMTHQQEGRIVINLAGKQRMLTQKMSKEALLIIKGIKVKQNQQHLKETIALFDATLKGLRDGDPQRKLPPTSDSKILHEIDRGDKLWHLFKKFLNKVVEGHADQETLKAVEIANMPLLKVMNNIVKLYEKKYTSDLSPNVAKTINLAGRERMLIQKMTKELLLIANNSQSDAYIKSLQGDGRLFQEKLSELMDEEAHIQDPKLAQRIQRIQSLWKEYQEIIASTELSQSGIKKFNKRERQIMQKMTQDLINVALLIDAKRYQINLQETEHLFDTTLTALMHGDSKLGIQPTTNGAIQNQLQKVKRLWLTYQPIIQKVDTSDKALHQAMQINMPLLNEMDKAVKLYEVDAVIE